MGPFIANIVQYISNKMQLYTVYYTWKLFFMFRVLLPPIIKSAYNYLHHLVQGVSLATEPGISLIILPLMKILQRNLKRTYLIVKEM